MNAFKRLRTFMCLLVIFMPATFSTVNAEVLLNKIISIEVESTSLQKTLEMISRKGGFYFSYNSNIVKGDSIVSLNLNNAPVKRVLTTLFNKKYEYSETGNYIIIKKSPEHVVIINTKAKTQDEFYLVSGYVKDDRTGEKLGNASVYEKERLISTLTDENGYFELKLRSKYAAAAITVSKEYYDDTTITVQPKYNQEITINIVPVDTMFEITTVSPVPVNIAGNDTLVPGAAADSSAPVYTTKKIDPARQKKTALGQFFLSSAQKIQSLNIGKFIAERTYQVSFTPGLGTHGKLSGQVINNVSLNILGGYNAGVKGAEFGLLFNINRYDVGDAQFAGVFNITGGSVTGVQAAGIHNLVMGNVTGMQLASTVNVVRGSLNGVQASVVYNHIQNNTKGIQAAGIANYTHLKTTGLQLAGVANISNESINGIQAAGIFNYTKKLHGVQVGLINIAESSDGYSIGLINFVVKGYHKLSISTNEIMTVNAAFRTGNKQLYSILIAGLNAGRNEKLYSYGYGLGTAIRLSTHLSINPEISSQYLYRGSWKYTNLLNKFSPLFFYRIDNFISIIAGPAFNVYYSNQTTDVAGYKSVIPPSGYHLFDLNNNKLKSWIGWNVGVSLF